MYFIRLLNKLYLICRLMLYVNLKILILFYNNIAAGSIYCLMDRLLPIVGYTFY